MIFMMFLPWVVYAYNALRHLVDDTTKNCLTLYHFLLYRIIDHN